MSTKDKKRKKAWTLKYILMRRMVAPFTCVIKISRACNNAQKYTHPQKAFSKLLKCFWNTFIKKHLWLSTSAECTSQNYTGPPIMLCLWFDAPCCEKSCEQQLNSKRFNGDTKTMFPAKIYIKFQSPHITKRTKLLISECFCTL